MEKTRKKIQVGHRYGEWIIMGEAQRFGADTRYPCRCACGQERMVSGITLRNGNSTDCGCKRKEHTTRAPDYESKPTTPEIQEIYQLISKGCLPPADQFSKKDGAPTWSLAAIARILGLSPGELVESLKNAGSRFDVYEQI